MPEGEFTFSELKAYADAQAAREAEIRRLPRHGCAASRNAMTATGQSHQPSTRRSATGRSPRGRPTVADRSHPPVGGGDNSIPALAESATGLPWLSKVTVIVCCQTDPSEYVMSQDADTSALTAGGFDTVAGSQFAEVACPSLPASAGSAPPPTAMLATSCATCWGSSVGEPVGVVAATLGAVGTIGPLGPGWAWPAAVGLRTGAEGTTGPLAAGGVAPGAVGTTGPFPELSHPEAAARSSRAARTATAKRRIGDAPDSITLRGVWSIALRPPPPSGALWLIVAPDIPQSYRSATTLGVRALSDS